MNVRGALRTGLSTAAAGMLLVGVAGPAQAQSAAGASTVLSQSSARVLSGSIASTNLDTIAAAAGTIATNHGGATVSKDVTPDLTLLNQQALTVPLGQVKGSLQNAIPGVSLSGLVEQKVIARANGSSSGTASTAGLGLDLGKVTQGATDALATLNLSFGAVIAHAAEAALPSTTQTGSCTIAGLGLHLTSPLLAQLIGQLTTALAPLNTLLSTLTSKLPNQVVSITGIPTISDVLATLGNIETPDGSIKIDLQTGKVDIDIAALLGKAGLDFCAKPNSKPLAVLGDALGTTIPKLLSDALQGVAGTVSTALKFCSTAQQTGCISVQIAGQFVPVGSLTSQVTTALSGAAATITTNLTPVLASVGGLLTQLSAALAGVIDITTNLQTTSGGTFRETALRIDLLSAAGGASQLAASDPLVRLNLATATVGPSAAAPTTTPPTSTPPTTPGTPIKVDAGRAGPAGDGGLGGISLLWVGIVLIAGGAGGTVWLRRKAPGHL